MAKSARASITQQRELLESAINLHRMGEFANAKSSYLTILKANPRQVDALHLLGVVELQAGNWGVAEQYISKSLAINPDQPGALNNYGIVLKELKQFPLAIDQYLKAINLNAYDANTYMNLGNAYQAAGSYEAAVKAYDTSIVLEPALVPAIVNKAFALSRLGREVYAIHNYKIALKVNSQDPNIYNNLGNSLKNVNELRLALTCYEKAQDLDPNYADAYFNQGNLLRELGDLEKALLSYEKAIEIKPNVVEHYINLGNLLRELKRPKDAFYSLTNALRLKVDFTQAYNNRGNAALDLGQYANALDDYSFAIALDPGYCEAYNNKGNVLRLIADMTAARLHYQRASRLDSSYADAQNNIGVLCVESSLVKFSIDYFDHALELNPNFTDAYFNRANALRELKHFKEAILDYRKALAINPCYEFLEGLLLHSKMQICDWVNIEAHVTHLVKSIELGERCTPPFPVLGLVDSPELQLKAARLWADSKYPATPVSAPFISQVKRQDNRKIRLGYFSADFREHPVAYLMADLFEHHDRHKFEIVAFSLGPNQRDAMRERLEQSFDIWVESFTLSDDELVARAREMGIDIAIDLGGFTRSSRTGIFAKRLAPVQVSYIGYLGTMGAPYMDYLLADKVVIPPELTCFYSEQIAYIPIYQANDSRRVMSAHPMTRADLGLPDEAFVYCCFNTNYKITSDVFSTWMKILNKVEGSVMLIYADTELAKVNLMHKAVLCGVNVSRIYFAERLTQPEYLLRYTLVDLFLDTSPYNAGTTASDALWSGLPVLTLMGKAFAARIASSLLYALDMPELVAQSLNEYEEIAIELGQNPQKLRAIKSKLKSQKAKTDLFNTQKFTYELEQVYIEMVRSSRAGELIKDIEIS